MLHYIGAGEIHDPETIGDLFRSCAGWRDTDTDRSTPINIPYFRDADGWTPLDYCLTADSRGRSAGAKSTHPLRRQISRDHARALMHGVKDYPTGHFESLLTIGASLAIENSVPGVDEFL